MNFLPYRVSLALFLFSLPVIPLYAQSEAARVSSNFFQEERFLIADQNDDARLDREEMQIFPEEFVYFLDSRHLEWADRNHDNLLTFQEVRTASQAEMNFRFQQDRRAIMDLARQYPMLAQADESYLKDRPELVVALFSNFNWMLENADLAQSLYTDMGWTSRHPETMLALHRNLRWMVANPENARRLYRDRRITQQLPEFLAWRADHQDLIRRYPSNIRVYDLDFVHTAIRIRR